MLLKWSNCLALYGALAGTVATRPPSRTAPAGRGVGLWQRMVACSHSPEPNVFAGKLVPLRAGWTRPLEIVSRLAWYGSTSVASVTPLPLLRAIGKPLLLLLGTLIGSPLSGPRAKSGIVTA